MTNVKLDLEFVLIPAGPFVMGSNPRQDREADPDERPQHGFTVAEFYCARYPVTNAQYQDFVAATGHRSPLFWPDGRMPEDKADHPVVGVNFHDCLTFCGWAAELLGLPIRLPTEPEWEKASRGSDGRIYPWGNTWEPEHCNSFEAGARDTTPVGRFTPAGESPYGIADMIGNVSEWCLSMFGPYPYRPTDGRESVFIEEGRHIPWGATWGLSTTNEPSRLRGMEQRVLRGASWRERKGSCRCAHRSWAAALHRSDDTGFRCAYSPTSKE